MARNGVVTLLREHLRANLLKLGRGWHYQRTGIPQVQMSLSFAARHQPFECLSPLPMKLL